MRAAVEGIAINGAVNGLAPPKRARAFAKARRHSRWVRLFKVLIPAGAAFGALAIGLAPFLDPLSKIEGLTLGPISVSGTQVAMERPRLTGFKDDARPYEVTATHALQDVRRPHIVELKNMSARIATDDRGSVARLEARTGVLDTQSEQMELKEAIRVSTESGQEVKLRSASVNFKAGTVVSREPVTVTLPNAVINAHGMTVKESGKIIHFTGRVSTVFDNNAVAPSPAPAQAEPRPAPLAAPLAAPIATPAPSQAPAKSPRS